jgi:predicted metal-dependent hydrolase
MTRPPDDRIPYKVVRSRRSTADVVIEPDGSVVVRAPEWTDDAQVDAIVAEKSYWIYKNLAEWRELNSSRVLREYKNGEGFLFLGRSYRLALVSNQTQPLQVLDEWFSLRRELVETSDMETAKAAFRDFYAAEGRTRMRERVQYFSPKVGVAVANVDVRELGNRWASCSPSGALAFHWKCIMAPLSIIDYIVVHELCHLRHRDHTDAFWNEVDKVLPDYRERKDWLRKNGAGLDV